MEGRGVEGDGRLVMVACVVSGSLFSFLTSLSICILCAVNWRPWRIYSWIFARKWPQVIQGPQLGVVCSFLSLSAWIVVISPFAVLVMWGSWLIALLDRDIIGLAVIMAGAALLLSFYSIMLWWRTQWQSSRAVAILLLLAVALLCAYELCAVYVTAGSSASDRYSPSGFFFGVSAIALAINMMFICRMVFNGNGLDVDEYVRRSYKFAYSDCIEVLKQMSLSKLAAIGVKNMGELDSKLFQEACKRIYPGTQVDLKSLQLCSLWEDYLRDPGWHPFRITKVNDCHQAVSLIFCCQYVYHATHTHMHIYTNIRCLWKFIQCMREPDAHFDGPYNKI